MDLLAKGANTTQTFMFCRTPSATDTIYLTEAALQALGRSHLGRNLFSHGVRRIHADVIPIKGSGTVLPIAPETADRLGMIEGIPYRLGWQRGEVVIGPVIGILVASHSDKIDLNPGSLEQQFILRYPSTGGLVYLFGAESMDVEAGTIDGYCWVPSATDAETNEPHPELIKAERLAHKVHHRAKTEIKPPALSQRAAQFQKASGAFMAEVERPEPCTNWHGLSGLGSGGWKSGRFPLPAAIWRRSGFLSDRRLESLLRQTGPTVFNSHFFNKAQAFRLLSSDHGLAQHIPRTDPLGTLEALVERLYREPILILKQTEGNSGYGLLKIERKKDGTFTLVARKRTMILTCQDRADLVATLRTSLSTSGYLVQQYIQLPAYQGRPIDFRVMMQKDGRGEWQKTAMIGRFGQKGSIVTNFINAGYAMDAHRALSLAFSVDHREAYRLQEQLSSFAHRVCRVLDQSGGCYGDLGLDIAIDTERKPWLFEINKLPFHELPLSYTKS